MISSDTTVFVNAGEVVTLAGPPRARRGSEMRDAVVRQDCGVAVQGDRILAVASDRELRDAHPNAAIVDCEGRVLTPGLVDSHTHTVFGAGRFAEHELRATGVPYLEIARRGGGIHSSVRDLRQRTEDELVTASVPRVRRMLASGVTTIEMKSGYGLSLDAELRSLRVVRRLESMFPCRMVPTFLGAHEIPTEYRERDGGRDAYVNEVCETMLPAVAAEKLAQFADVFCEPGVFTTSEARRVLEAARRNGLALKLHADELENGGGAELAVSLRATSADHLAAISDAGIAALAGSDTVATLLPATMLFLGRPAHAPARKLIQQGAAVALATDFNPGTSPLSNIGIVLTLAVSSLRMSVAEALVATTVNGAAALGLADRVGQLAPGFTADLALWDARDHRELAYWFGERLCVASWARGKPCHH